MKKNRRLAAAVMTGVFAAVMMLPLAAEAGNGGHRRNSNRSQTGYAAQSGETVRERKQLRDGTCQAEPGTPADAPRHRERERKQYRDGTCLTNPVVEQEVNP